MYGVAAFFTSSSSSQQSAARSRFRRAACVPRRVVYCAALAVLVDTGHLVRAHGHRSQRIRAPGAAAASSLPPLPPRAPRRLAPAALTRASPPAAGSPLPCATSACRSRHIIPPTSSMQQGVAAAQAAPSNTSLVGARASSHQYVASPREARCARAVQIAIQQVERLNRHMATRRVYQLHHARIARAVVVQPQVRRDMVAAQPLAAALVPMNSGSVCYHP